MRTLTLPLGALALALVSLADLGCSGTSRSDKLSVQSKRLDSQTLGVCSANKDRTSFNEVLGVSASTLDQAWADAQQRFGRPFALYACADPAVLNAFADSTDFMQAWRAARQQVRAYVKAKGNAEIYRSSIAADDELAKYAIQLQVAIYNQTKSGRDAILTDFKSQVAQVSGVPIMQTNVAQTSSNLKELAAAWEGAQIEAAPLQQPFADFIHQFATYRDTESTVAAHWQDIATRASAADYVQLASLQDEAISLWRDEAGRQEPVLSSANQLKGTFEVAAKKLADELAPFDSLVAGNQIKQLNYFAGPVSGIDNALAYCERRQARTEQNLNNILAGIHARQEALILAGSDQSTRDSIASARLLQASADFLASIDQQSSVLWVQPPKSTKLALPYLATNYDAFTKFLELEPLCPSTGVLAWRETGCNALKVNLSKAHFYLEKTVPGLLRIGAVKLKGQGPSDALVQDILNKLAAGDVKGAVLSYDEALRASDR